MVYLAFQLRLYRLRHNLNSQAFADNISISKNYLDKLESTSLKTRKTINTQLVRHICETFQDWSLYEEYEKALIEELRNLRGTKSVMSS